MTPTEAAAILKKHNLWRKYDGITSPTPNPHAPELIGEAIDAAVKYIEDNDHE